MVAVRSRICLRLFMANSARGNVVTVLLVSSSGRCRFARIHMFDMLRTDFVRVFTFFEFT